MTGTEYLNAPLTRELLNKMGENLASQVMKAEIALYGGSSLLFTLEDRKTTKDIDYLNIGVANAELEKISVDMAAEHGLPNNWFSDVTEIITSETPDYVLLGDFPQDKPGLKVFIASPLYVLAMKLQACRSSLESNDIRDIWLLLKHCEITEAQDAIDIYTKFFPYEPLAPRNEAILQDLIQAQKDGKEYDPMIGW